MKRLLAARQIHVVPNPFPQHWKEQNRTDMERNKQAYIFSLQDCREFCSVDDEYGNATEFFTWYPPDFGHPSFDIRHIISSGVLSLNVIRPYQCLLVDLISF